MARQRGRTWAVWGSAVQGCQVAWVLVWAGTRQAKQAPGHLILELVAYRKPRVLKHRKTGLPTPTTKSQVQTGFLFKAMIIAADHL